MGKMLYQALILILMIEIAFALFEDTGVVTSPVYDQIEGFVNMTESSFYVLLFSAVATVAAAGIFLGTGLSATDWIWRATLAGVIITFGASLIHVFTFITIKADLLGDFTLPLAMIVGGALFLFYFMAVLDFVSGKD